MDAYGKLEILCELWQKYRDVEFQSLTSTEKREIDIFLDSIEDVIRAVKFMDL